MLAHAHTIEVNMAELLGFDDTSKLPIGHTAAGEPVYDEVGAYAALGLVPLLFWGPAPGDIAWVIIAGEKDWYMRVKEHGTGRVILIPLSVAQATGLSTAVTEPESAGLTPEVAKARKENVAEQLAESAASQARQDELLGRASLGLLWDELLAIPRQLAAWGVPGALVALGAVVGVIWLVRR